MQDGRHQIGPIVFQFDSLAAAVDHAPRQSKKSHPLKGRKVSAAARRNMKKAQQKRWAEIRATKQEK